MAADDGALDRSWQARGRPITGKYQAGDGRERRRSLGLAGRQ